LIGGSLVLGTGGGAWGFQKLASLRQALVALAAGEEAPGSGPGQATWRMRWKPLGRTWMRKRRMNSGVPSVMVV
jgi:hypothetical protein